MLSNASPTLWPDSCHASLFDEEGRVGLADDGFQRTTGVGLIHRTFAPSRQDAECVHGYLVNLLEFVDQHRRAAASGAAAESGDDEEGVRSRCDPSVEGVHHFASVVLHHFGTEFVIATYTVPLHPVLSDENGI